MASLIPEPKSSGPYGWIFWKGPVDGGFPLLNSVTNEGARRDICWFLRRRRNQKIKATIAASPAIPPTAPPAIAPNLAFEGWEVSDPADEAATALGLVVGETSAAGIFEELLKVDVEDEAVETLLEIVDDAAPLITLLTSCSAPKKTLTPVYTT